MAYTHNYKRRSNVSPGLIFIILLVGTAWTHREQLSTIAHWIIIGLAVVASIFVLVILVRVFRAYRQYRRRHVLDVAGVDEMNGTEFERYVALLLTAQGYNDVRLTECFDLGIDIIANRDGICWGIQVKRHSDMVKAYAVRQAVTALKHYDCDRAMVVTNSTYSKVATKLARSNDCVLIDRLKLTQWIEQLNGGKRDVL